MWIDVTWGAGGSTADKTLEICINALKYHGLNVMMHLTCTNMPKEKLKEALDTCKEHGIRNILALRVTLLAILRREPKVKDSRFV